MIERHVLASVGAAALSLASPATVVGQTRWSVPATVGYTAAGLAAGAAVAVSDAPEGSTEFVSARGMMAVPLGLTVGAIVGRRVGVRADRALARGDTLAASHRWAVRAGTVLTGAAVGVGVATVLIFPDGPSPFGSDEAIAAGAVVGGTALGVLAQYALDRRLWPRDGVRVGIVPHGDGVRVAVGLATR